MLEPQQRKDIIVYRIEKAYKSLEEAKGFSPKTHAGVIHLIGEKFISTGLLSRSYGRLFSRLYELRQSGDYDDMYDATEEEVMPYFDCVATLLYELEKLITCK